MTSITRSNTDSRLSPVSRTLLLGGGAVVAVGINWVIASLAIVGGASAGFVPLAIYVFGPLTVVGYVAACLGWRIIRSRSARPATVLRVLVPVLTLLSFVPHIVLLATGFLPDSTPLGVLALALMHLIVVTAVVLVSQRTTSVR
jgi:hypothetical protein